MKPDVQKIVEKIKSRRVLVGMLTGAVLAFLGCAGSLRSDTADLSPEDKILRHKYRGIYGGVNYFDAVGYRKEYLTMYDENGKMWFASMAGVGAGGGQHYSFTDAMSIPKTIQVTWRTGDVRAKKDKLGNRNYLVAGLEGGTILGDYTVPLAERISDEVLDYIRKNGGALRIKIRLKDDGVLIGWDVEERVPLDTPGAGNYLRLVMPGGDFREVQKLDGKIIDPGWQK